MGEATGPGRGATGAATSAASGDCGTDAHCPLPTAWCVPHSVPLVGIPGGSEPSYPQQSLLISPHQLLSCPTCPLPRAAWGHPQILLPTPASGGPRPKARGCLSNLEASLPTLISRQQTAASDQPFLAVSRFQLKVEGGSTVFSSLEFLGKPQVGLEPKISFPLSVKPKDTWTLESV